MAKFNLSTMSVGDTVTFSNGAEAKVVTARKKDGSLFVGQAPHHAHAQAHTVARHHAFALQPRDARHHGGARQPQLPCQGGGALTGVGLQQAQKLAIGLIQGRVHGVSGHFVEMTNNKSVFAELHATH